MNLNNINIKKIFYLQAIFVLLFLLQIFFIKNIYISFAEEASTTAPQQIIEQENSNNNEDNTNELDNNKTSTSTDETSVNTGDADSYFEGENLVNINNVDTDNDNQGNESEEESGDLDNGKDNDLDNNDDFNTSTTTSEQVQETSQEGTLSEGEAENNTASSTEGNLDENSTTTVDLLQDENYNNTPNSTTTSTSTTPATATSTDNVYDDKHEDEENASDINIENNNTANIENNISVEAQTGDNTSSGGSITTGDAYAEAKILNLSNLNVINSTGFFEFLTNFFNSSLLNLDLREHPFFSQDNNSSPCGLGCQNNTDTIISNNNNSTTTNNIEVYAGTGENIIPEGGGSVITGDAYASANVINITNTNIVDSNYLFLVFNSLGDWEGDLIFPPQDIFKDILSDTNGTPANISNNNTANIENNISVEAQTGDNTSSGGSITTGDATGNASVTNVINTNITSSQPFFAMIRLNGDWSGTLYGLPEGMSWSKENDTIYLYSDDLVNKTKTSSNNGLQEGLKNGTPANIENNNTANIENNISVEAQTGDNTSSGGSITTGDAYASANVINVANANIIGRNVMFSIFNVFGNWSGDISFGRPDLWVGGIAHMKNPTPSINQIVEYRFKIKNNGDLKASYTKFKANWPEELRVEYSNFGYFMDEEGNAIWAIGDIGPGEVKDLYIRTAVDYLPYGTTDVNLTGEVYSEEKDNNYEDNKDTLTFQGYRAKNIITGEGPVYSAPPKLRVEKFVSATSTTASSTVGYKIIITNLGGGPTYGSVLVDTLYDENGSVIHEEEWDFGKIFGNEEIIVEYNVEFNENIKEGVYTNSAKVFALGGHPEFKYGYFADSNTASTNIFVKGIKKDKNTSTEEDIDQEKGNSSDKDNSQTENTPKEETIQLPKFERKEIKRDIIIKPDTESFNSIRGLRDIPSFQLFIPRIAKLPENQTDSIEASSYDQIALIKLTSKDNKNDKEKNYPYAIALFIGILGAVTKTSRSKWLLL